MMQTRESLVLVLLAAVFAWGAPWQEAGAVPARPEIRGVVLEPGVNLPIADAEVSLFGQTPGPVRINGGWNTDPSAETKTDESGGFKLALDKPGLYRVSAAKPGYIAPGASGGAEYAEVTVTAEKPAADVKLFLTRPGRLTGTVVDEDTGKPIANLQLGAVNPARPPGWPAVSSATTDGRGEFAIADLPPGDYEVEIRPQIDQDQRVLTKFSEKDAQTVERDFERTYWPGGHGKDSAIPVTVASGVSVYVGQLPVRKVAYYRVHVRIPPSNCKAGDKMYIMEAIGSMVHPLAQTPPCDKDMLVTGFSAGTYGLRFGVAGLAASVPFSIVDKNIEITALLTEGFPVDGAFVAADGAKTPDFTKVRLLLRATDSGGISPLPATADTDGKFRVENVQPLSHLLSISGMGAGNYVSEIRYNGRPLSADVVPLDDGAVAHTLTIVVDDKPATIAGSVVSRDEPVSRPFVIARKWPSNGGKGLMGWAGSQGDETGRFQITGLAPGEYRIIALRTLSRDMNSGTPALERALAAGQKAEVDKNGFLSVTLEVTELQ